MGLGYSSYSGRSHWYIQSWGPPDDVHETCMDDSSVKLGIMRFPPRASTGEIVARSCFTYATNGMSERRMPCLNAPHGNPEYRVELLAYARAESQWINELLCDMARYPFVHGSGLALGHTLPVQQNAKGFWKGFLLTQPRLEPPTFNPLAIDIGIGSDWVFYLQVLGLFENELEEAIDIGGPEFSRRYLPENLPIDTFYIDNQRASLL